MFLYRAPFEKALEEDRNYALAYAGLADAYPNLGGYGYIAPIEGRRKAEEAARKAFALDEDLAEAHVAIGLPHFVFAPSDCSLSDRELRRAIELSPSLAVPHQYLGISLVRQGRLDEGVVELLKARELDPLSSTIAHVMALPYYLKRDYVRALELLRQANELGPAFSQTWEIGAYIISKTIFRRQRTRRITTLRWQVGCSVEANHIEDLSRKIKNNRHAIRVSRGTLYVALCNVRRSGEETYEADTDGFNIGCLCGKSCGANGVDKRNSDG